MSLVINTNTDNNTSGSLRLWNEILDSFYNPIGWIILSPESTINHNWTNSQNSQFFINWTGFNISREFSPDLLFWDFTNRFINIGNEITITRKMYTQNHSIPYRIISTWFFEWGEVVGKRIQIKIAKNDRYTTNINYTLQVWLAHTDWTLSFFYEETNTASPFLWWNKVIEGNGLVARKWDRAFFQISFNILDWSTRWDAEHWFYFGCLWSLNSNNRMWWIKISIE